MYKILFQPRRAFEGQIQRFASSKRYVNMRSVL